MPVAYSYIRWSSAKQSEGTSDERQTDLITAYINKHGLTLSNTNYKDPGVSAATGKNASAGALGAFLDACKTGVIPKGSFLLVEAFDRLSRMPVFDALALFQQIVGHGITLVTLEDGLTYSTQSINQNWTMLIYALSKMDGAHAENAKRQSRVKAHWDQARLHQRILTSVGPAWLKLEGPKPKLKTDPDERKWVKIPHQVEKIQRIFQLAVEGNLGAPAISKTLNEEGVETMTPKSSQWSTGVVMAILKNEAVTGVYQQRDGADRREKYYPAIVSRKDFDATQLHIAGRHRNGPRKSDVVSNLFPGMWRCPCGSKMRYVNGNPKYLYLRCIKAYENAGCDAIAHPYHALEDEILELLGAWFEVPLHAKAQIDIDVISPIKAEIERKQAQVKNLYALAAEGTAIAAGGLSGAAALIAQREEEIRELQQKLKTLHQPPPLEEISAQALNTIIRHWALKAAGPSDELNAERRRLQGALRMVLSKIVISNERHEKSKMVVRKRETFTVKNNPRTGEYKVPRTERWYEPTITRHGTFTLYGPFVDRIKTEAATDEGLKTWAAAFKSQTKERDGNIEFTGDGGLNGTFELLDWHGHDAIRRRNRTRKSA